VLIRIATIIGSPRQGGLAASPVPSPASRDHSKPKERRKVGQPFDGSFPRGTIEPVAASFYFKGRRHPRLAAEKKNRLLFREWKQRVQHAFSRHAHHWKKKKQGRREGILMKTGKTRRNEPAVITRKEAIRIFNIREPELGFFERDAKINACEKRGGYTLSEFRVLSRRVRAFYRDPKPRRSAQNCVC
jgi:hypothetical protein